MKDESPAMWSPPFGEDGTYDVRVVAKCTTATDPAAVDKSETTTVRGVVDRVPPSVVAITSGTGDFSDRWVVTATFSEDIVCRGDNWYLDAKIKVGTGPAPPVTVYVCDGPKLMMALPDQIAPPDSTMAVEVSIESGVRDGAGNDIEPVVIELAVGESLRVAHAMNKSLHSKLDRTNTDVQFMQVTLDAILNTVVGGADVAKAEATKRADEAAAAAERFQEVMELQEAQKKEATDAAAAAAATAAAAAEEKALLAAEAGVDADILAELEAEREALKVAKAELVAARAESAARHARNARATIPEDGSAVTPTARHDLAALLETVNLAERRVGNAEAILDENIAQVVEYMEPGSPLAARLADSQAKLKAATADADAAAETETKASAKLAQAKEAKSAADTKAAASKYQASLDFEKSPLATSQGSSNSFKATEAQADTLSNVNRVAAATLAFVLIAIVLIVAVGYRGHLVVVSHIQALALHKGHPQSGAEQADGSNTLRVVRGSAQEHDNPAYSAMPTFVADVSVNALNSPDQADSDEESSPTIRSVGGAGYYMATATDSPEESTTAADQARPGSDGVRARASTAWGTRASIVLNSSPDGGAPSVAYQMATADDPYGNEVSTDETNFDSVASLPRPRSKWSKVAGSVRVAAQFSKISNM
jgi:chemotaxis protein histidine kinase CheA